MKCIINRIIFLTRTAWFKNQVAFLIRKVYFFNGAGKSILSRNTSATAGYTCEMQAANESSSSWLSCLPPQGRCLPSSRRLPPCWRWQDPSVRSLRWFPSPVACHSPLWIEFYRPSLLLCITSCKLFFLKKVSHGDCFSPPCSRAASLSEPRSRPEVLPSPQCTRSSGARGPRLQPTCPPRLSRPLRGRAASSSQGFDCPAPRPPSELGAQLRSSRTPGEAEHGPGGDPTGRPPDPPLQAAEGGKSPRRREEFLRPSPAVRRHSAGEGTQCRRVPPPEGKGAGGFSSPAGTNGERPVGLYGPKAAGGSARLPRCCRNCSLVGKAFLWCLSNEGHPLEPSNLPPLISTGGTYSPKSPNSESRRSRMCKRSCPWPFSTVLLWSLNTQQKRHCFPYRFFSQ